MGIFSSLGGFLGLSGGDNLEDTNPYLRQYANYATNPDSLKYTDPETGTKLATEEVQNNPILGSLFGNGGALSRALGKEQELQGQGFELKPEDHSLYGQASDNIARQFGQSGNSISNNLAMRGLSSAPSGAAGAMFSGAQGSQNEQLAQAQQQIMQQRFQNTMHQISQQQSFINSLGGQAQNAIGSQYQRNAQGVASHAGALQGASGAMTDLTNWNKAAQPANFVDMLAYAGPAAVGSGASAYGKGVGTRLSGQKPYNSMQTNTLDEGVDDPNGTSKGKSGLLGLFA